jgi:uncharacterized membrane protein
MSMDQQQIIRAAMAAVIAAGLNGVAVAHAGNAPTGMELCYGIAKAGQNDCAAGTGAAMHQCAGMSKKDNDPGEFKFVKTGTCAKLGGKLEAAPKGKKS